MTSPVLITANYEKQFSFYVDASDVGIGAVLTQLCSDDVDHPYRSTVKSSTNISVIIPLLKKNVSLLSQLCIIMMCMSM